jgi:hypothetical protein
MAISRKDVYTAEQYAGLSSAEREARELALEALSYMRHDGLSLTDAGEGWHHARQRSPLCRCGHNTGPARTVRPSSG